VVPLHSPCSSACHPPPCSSEQAPFISALPSCGSSAQLCFSLFYCFLKRDRFCLPHSQGGNKLVSQLEVHKTQSRCHQTIFTSCSAQVTSFQLVTCEVSLLPALRSCGVCVPCLALPGCGDVPGDFEGALLCMFPPAAPATAPEPLVQRCPCSQMNVLPRTGLEQRVGQD